MKRLLLIGLFNLFCIHSIELSADNNITNNFQIIFSDNVTLTGGPNDLGPTGDLKFIYTNPSDTSKIKIDWEIYVNGAPGEKTTVRTDPKNLRIDTLKVSYIQGNAFKYGIGLELLGNIGGEKIQNELHNLAGDSHIPAKYSGDTKMTPTINLEYTSVFFEKNIDIYSYLNLPVILKNGIVEFQILLSHTFKNIFDLNIDTSIGLNLDCKKYPDLPAFKGYPLRDFNVCTPETLLSLGYENFTFFIETPLMNNDIQNSIMGFSYKF